MFLWSSDCPSLKLRKWYLYLRKVPICLDLESFFLELSESKWELDACRGLIGDLDSALSLLLFTSATTDSDTCSVTVVVRHIVPGGIYSSLIAGVPSKLCQLFLLCGRARLHSLHLEGDRPSTAWSVRSYPSQSSQSVRAMVLLLKVRRHTPSFGANQPQYVWSATMRLLTLFVKNIWSVTTQHGCSAEWPYQVRAMLYEGYLVLLDESHVSKPERFKKFATNNVDWQSEHGIQQNNTTLFETSQ